MGQGLSLASGSVVKTGERTRRAILCFAQAMVSYGMSHALKGNNAYGREASPPGRALLR